MNKNFKLILSLQILLGLALTIGCDKQRAGDHNINTPAGSGQNSNNQGAVLEGTINGGGGRGMLCKINGKETLEVLDLFEARSNGLALLQSPASDDEAYSLAAHQWANHIWLPNHIPIAETIEPLKKLFSEKYLSQVTFLKGNQSLRLIDDSHELIKDENCQPVQIAAYVETKLYVVEKYWKMLNPLNRAALLSHEIVYMSERQGGAKNSISTRILIGQLFSTKGARRRAEGLPPREQLMVCGFRTDDRFSGEAFAKVETENNHKKVEFVFSSLKNASTLLRTTLSFQGVGFDEFLDAKSDQKHEGEYRIDSLVGFREAQLILKKGARPKVVIFNKDDSAYGQFDLDCRVDGRPAVLMSEDRQREQPIPAPPAQVEMLSRYSGVGSYSKTATYSFRYMTHDENLTLNTWDILFEARNDFPKDYFQVRLAGDYKGVVKLMNGSSRCASMDPCEVSQLLQAASESSTDRANVEVGGCYFLKSETRWGKVAVLFEVADHKKSQSVVIKNISVIDEKSPPVCKK